MWRSGRPGPRPNRRLTEAGDRNGAMPAAASETAGTAQVRGLADLLERLTGAGREADALLVGDVLAITGRGSLGPLLLVAEIVTLTPLVGDIPGVPTLAAVLVLISIVQIFLNREYLWLPDWLLERSIDGNRAAGGRERLRHPTGFGGR